MRVFQLMHNSAKYVNMRKGEIILFVGIKLKLLYNYFQLEYLQIWNILW